MIPKLLTLIISTLIITALPLFKPVTDPQGITLHGYIVIGAAIILIGFGIMTIINDEKESDTKKRNELLLNQKIDEQNAKITNQSELLEEQSEMLAKINDAMKEKGIFFNTETGAINNIDDHSSSYVNDHSSIIGVSLNNVNAKEMHIKNNKVIDNRIRSKKAR